MKYLKLFENFGHNFKHIEFLNLDVEVQSIPVSPNQDDYILYAELYKSLPGPWCSSRNEIMGAFDLQDGYLQNHRVDFQQATNGIDEWYLDITKHSETGDEMVDSNDAWYVIDIFPKENESEGFQIKCDGEIGLKEFIEFTKNWQPDLKALQFFLISPALGRQYHSACDEYFEMLKSFVR